MATWQPLPRLAKTLNPSHLKYGFFGYLKHVDAHIKETIILHNIVIHIEIEASTSHVISCLVEHIT